MENQSQNQDQNENKNENQKFQLIQFIQSSPCKKKLTDLIEDSVRKYDDEIMAKNVRRLRDRQQMASPFPSQQKYLLDLERIIKKYTHFFEGTQFGPQFGLRLGSQFANRQNRWGAIINLSQCLEELAGTSPMTSEDLSEFWQKSTDCLTSSLDTLKIDPKFKTNNSIERVFSLREYALSSYDLNRPSTYFFELCHLSSFPEVKKRFYGMPIHFDQLGLGLILSIQLNSDLNPNLALRSLEATLKTVLSQFMGDFID